MAKVTDLFPSVSFSKCKNWRSFAVSVQKLPTKFHITSREIIEKSRNSVNNATNLSLLASKQMISILFCEFRNLRSNSLESWMILENAGEHWVTLEYLGLHTEDSDNIGNIILGLVSFWFPETLFRNSGISWQSSMILQNIFYFPRRNTQNFQGNLVGSRREIGKIKCWVKPSFWWRTFSF